jgi:putative lipoic acid-binding regulatory protein
VKPVNSSDESTLIEYPCDFPIKIMGRVGSPSGTPPSAATLEYRRQDFAQNVLAIVKRHAPDFDEATMEVRISRKSNYLSLTCTIRAVSREQLDALYQELCDHPTVVMVL